VAASLAPLLTLRNFKVVICQMLSGCQWLQSHQFYDENTLNHPGQIRSTSYHLFSGLKVSHFTQEFYPISDKYSSD